jgi:phenylacetate-coenzyme A ligase PaaK-like adenylate-forming protein
MLGIMKRIYDLLPKEYFKFLRYIPDRLLFGKSYIEWQSKVSFDKKLIDQNLFETLNYARIHTQYGRDHIPEKFAISEVRTILESLPLTTSHDLATNLDYYTSDEFNRFNSYSTTTGGTGRNPTTLLLSNELFGIEWAHVHHIWSYADYDRQRDTKLTLRGKSLDSDKLAEYSPLYNELVVDVFKVNHNNFYQLLDTIKKYDIKYIHGYPSLLKEYMVYFQENHYQPELKGIFLASENACAEDKYLIAEFFKCKVISFYGQSERALIAVDIESNDMHRVYTSYGYPRVLNGELIITSFVNRAMPLINYQVGDGAELVEDEHYLYLKNLSGRWGKDFLYLNKDKKISTAAINLHSQIQNEIVYYQIHQNEFGKIEVRILQKSTSHLSPESMINTFSEEIKSKLKEFEVNVRIVNEDEIIKSNRGKMILLIQNLSLQQ